MTKVITHTEEINASRYMSDNNTYKAEINRFKDEVKDACKQRR
jgi:hypothetical protein